MSCRVQETHVAHRPSAELSHEAEQVALVSLRTVLGNAGATLVGAGELVPEVNLRVAGGRADDVLRTQLQELAGQLTDADAQAA